MVGCILMMPGLDLVLCLILLEEEVLQGGGGGLGECGLMKRGTKEIVDVTYIISKSLAFF